jgi:hypothetical protein
MSEDGLITIDAQHRFGAQLIQFRMALKMEILSTSGMVASRHMNARTIIPQLYEWSITDVLPNYSKKRKIQAYNDLDKFMTDNGFEPKPLDIPAKRK